MSFMDLCLQRRKNFFATPTSARRTMACRLNVETLEERQCLSVTSPTGLTLTALSPTQVKVSWNDGPGEFGYRIYRWDGAQAALVAQVAQNAKMFTLTGLPPNQMQWFTVEAFDNATTARSAWASVTTPPQAITAPTNLKVASATTTQITLNWGFATGATGYKVFGWDGTQAVQLGSVANSVNAFTVSNLTPGSTYYYYVQSYNATNSAVTGWLTASTTATAITAPGNITAKALDNTTIQISWKDSTGETGYRIYQWNGVNGVDPVLVTTLGANVTGYQAPNLFAGNTYWFYVQAFNGTGTANSIWAQATTTVTQTLLPPTQVTTVIDGPPSSVKVSWTEAAGAAGYIVFVWTGRIWIPNTSVAAGTHEVTINGLLTNRTQWFLVKAYTDNFAQVSYSSAVFINL